MSYYYSLIGFLDSGGEFNNLLGTPTITAINAISDANVGVVTFENIVTGVYRMSVENDDTDLPVAFIFVPHADDLAAGITSHILLHDKEASITVWENARKVNRI